MDELQERLEEVDMSRKRLQVELDDLVSTRGTADKNVHELEKAKRSLESQLAEQKTQVPIVFIDGVYLHYQCDIVISYHISVG